MAVEIEVHVLSGAMPSSAAITIDAIATANRLRELESRPAIFETRLSGSGARALRGLLGSSPKGESDRVADIVVVPGLGLTTEEQVRSRLARPDAIRAGKVLTTAADGGAEIATSCSGAFLLAATGLLNGRRATTAWWLAPLFRRLHPQVELDTDSLVVRDGAFTSAGAAMAQMDLMLSLIARYADGPLADQCARYLLLDQRRSQARYMALGFLASADSDIARAEAWARERLEHDFTIEEMAAVVGLTTRTFARRVHRTTGLSPIRFVQRIRVDAAMALLETTKLSVEEIARRVGYAEPTTLRRLVRRQIGLSPRDIRHEPKA